jgi:rod shape determining protein RodA
MKPEYLTRSPLRSFDFLLAGCALLLCGVGALAIYSANLQSDSAYIKGLYLRQGIWIGVAFVMMIAATMFDYRTYERMAWPLYWIGVASLAYAGVAGRTVSGAQRWLTAGGLNIQPSEFMKIAMILVITRMLDDLEKDGALVLKELAKPLAFTLIPFLLVAKQPDLGTAMIYLVIFTGMALFHGINRMTIIKTVAAMAALAPVGWFLLKPYQKNRILTLLNPELDPMGKGYHIIQSKIAIGSGGLWGKGIFEGSQSKLNFLPEKHTDFIFSVISEEVGFIGSIILIAIFFFLIMRIIEAAMHSRDKCGSLMVCGVATMITFNFIYNIGMTLGLFPIVGVPLPFISYGGSSIVTNAIGLGIVLNVSMRRFSVD